MESPLSTEENLDQVYTEDTMFKTNNEKVEIFHSLYWMAYPIVILSIWNIVLPVVALPNSKQQGDLRNVSILTLLISIIIFIWSYFNYRFLKKDKGDEHYLSITQIKFEGGVYCLSYFAMTFLAAFLIGIYVNKNNERLVLQARFDLTEAGSIKAINVFQGTEILVGIVTIALFYFISKYTYYLEQNVNHRPVSLGTLFSLYILTIALLIFWKNADSLETALKPIQVEIGMDSYSFHAICVFEILVTIYFMIQNKIQTQKVIPKPNYYFLPMVLYTLMSGFIFYYGLNIVRTEQNRKYTKLGCVPSIQSFPYSFFSDLQCPKFDYLNGSSGAFNLKCNSESLGIYWEQDNTKVNAKKLNQLGCVRLDCCQILQQGYSFWDNHLLSYILLNCFMGLVVAYHCFDIGTHNPDEIKAKGLYSWFKLILQIIIPLIVILIFGIFAIYATSKPVQLNLKPDPPASLWQNKTQEVYAKEFKLYKNCHPLSTKISSLQQCSNLKVCFQGSQFVISPKLNNQLIQISNPENYFYGNTETQLCLKGNSTSIQTAMKNKIVYCSENENVQITTPTENCEASTPPPATRILQNFIGETANIKVVSADTGLPIKDAKVFAITGNNKCEGYNAQLTPKYRESSTNIQGKTTLYNVPPVSDIFVDMDGYMKSCIVFKQQTKDEFQVVSLVYELEDTELYKFVLTVQNSHYNLNLGIAFDYGTTLQCQVGIMNNLCGYANYSQKATQLPADIVKQVVNQEEKADKAEKKHAKEKSPNSKAAEKKIPTEVNLRKKARQDLPNYSQVIVINKLLLVKYLVYIFPLFENLNLRQQYYQSFDQLDANATAALSTYWQNINKAQPVLTVYSAKSTTPIYSQAITFPALSGRNLMMAFCFNGETFAFNPVNKAYSQTESFFPDSSNCP